MSPSLAVTHDTALWYTTNETNKNTAASGNNFEIDVLSYQSWQVVSLMDSCITGWLWRFAQVMKLPDMSFFLVWFTIVCLKDVISPNITSQGYCIFPKHKICCCCQALCIGKKVMAFPFQGTKLVSPVVAIHNTSYAILYSLSCLSYVYEVCYFH